MSKVFSIPFGYDFLEELHRFIAADARKLSETAIVFAGKRPSLYFRKKLGQQAQTPFYPPRFFSIEEFIDFVARKKHPNFADIDQIDAIWLLYQSVQSLSCFSGHPFREKGFGDFFWWGRYLFEFIEQLDMEGIQKEKLVSLERNAELGYDIPESTNELLSHVNALRDDFHKTLAGRKCFTKGYKHLCALTQAGEKPVTDFEKIYFAGIFALSGTAKEIIRQVWGTGKGEIILEGNPSEWPILADFTTFLDARVERISSSGRIPPEIRIHRAIDTHSEVLAAGGILKQSPQTKTAVVLPSAEALFPLLNFVVDDFDSPYNISLGYPLSRTSLFDLITHILNAQAMRRDREYYPAAGYLSIVLHPFVKNLDVEADVRAMVGRLERIFSEDVSDNAVSNRPFVTLEEIEGVLFGERTDPAYKTIHSIFFTSFEKARTLAGYIEKLEDVLEFMLRHSSVRSYILSGEIFRRIFEAFDNLKKTEFATTILHGSDTENRRVICDFILQYLKSLSLPFETKPIEEIEIIGVLESRNITFETVIMLDVNEGVMPQAKKINPLIPLGIYDILNIPSPEYNEEIYRYYFERLIRSARNIHLFYIDAEDRPRSRYIEQLIWEQEQSAGAVNTVEISKAASRINVRLQARQQAIEKTEEILRIVKGKTFSPSALDDYIACPVRFYFGRILGFEVKKPLSDDMEATDRGRIIHSILQETFTGYLNREISPSSCDQLISTLHRVIDRRFEKRQISGDYYLFRKLTTFKLESFLRRAIGEAAAPFILKHLETRVEGALEVKGQLVGIKGIIDRVDYYPDSNEYHVIDYKTGGTKQYPRSILRRCSFNSITDIHKYVNSFQLPLYLFLSMGRFKVPLTQARAKLILLRNNEEEEFSAGLTAGEREDLFKGYMEGVKTVLADLFDERKPFAPFDTENCSNCDFNSLCHV